MATQFLRNHLLEAMLKITGSSRVDQIIGASNGYSGSYTKAGIVSGDKTFFVFKTGSQAVGLEDITASTDFSLVTSGRMIITLTMYVDSSNINTWSYGANGTDLPVGRNLNAMDVNKVPLSSITVDPDNVLYSGIPDYELQFSEYFIDLQGNRETLSTNSESFFKSGRKILLGPDSEYLFISEASGDALGSATTHSIFFTSELVGEA